MGYKEQKQTTHIVHFIKKQPQPFCEGMRLFTSYILKSDLWIISVEGIW